MTWIRSYVLKQLLGNITRCLNANKKREKIPPQNIFKKKQKETKSLYKLTTKSQQYLKGIVNAQCKK